MAGSSELLAHRNKAGSHCGVFLSFVALGRQRGGQSLQLACQPVSLVNPASPDQRETLSQRRTQAAVRSTVKISNANNVGWAERLLGPRLQWVHCRLAPCAGTKPRGWRNVTIADRKGPGLRYFLQTAPPAGHWLYYTRARGGPYRSIGKREIWEEEIPSAAVRSWGKGEAAFPGAILCEPNRGYSVLFPDRGTMWK